MPNYQVKHKDKVPEWVHYCEACRKVLDDPDIMTLNEMMRDCKGKGHKITTRQL